MCAWRLPFRSKRKIRIAVDLVRLLPGGENGGVKPAVFAFLQWMIRTEGDRVELVFIANEATHGEVSSLARPTDQIWCSHQSAADPEPGSGPDPVDTERLVTSGVDLLYNPFGPDRLGGGKVPFVSLLIDLLHREVPEALPPEEVDHRERFFADACARAVAIQVISDDVGRRLSEAYGLGERRIFRTYLPLQQVHSSDRGNSGRSAADGLFFIYPANPWPHKNHRRLLEAFCRFLDGAPDGNGDWKLVLTGAGTESADPLGLIIDRLGLGGGSVIRAGHLDQADYRATLRAAHGMIFPSLNEGFGIPILEAQQAGIPLACSNVGSLPEVAGTGARYFDPKQVGEIADALSEMARDEGLRRRLIQAGRQNLGRFDFDCEARGFAQALRKAAAG
ncbi:MAG: glycosyltransferase family 1 protein [Opitutaceae bacterium]